MKNTKQNIEGTSRNNPLLNGVIVVGALIFLVASVFLYIKFDGKNAWINAESNASESNIQLSDQPGNVNQGQVAPEFTLSDPSGKNYSLTDFRGKPTLISFEATWCTFCHQQNSDIEKIKKDFGDKVNVITVDLREDAGTVLNAWQERSNARLVLVDSSGSVGSRYGVTGTPTNFFLNPDGTVAFKHPGLMGYDQMQEAFNDLI